MSTEKLRDALRRVKYEAVSLADAQVIALEALAQPSPPEQVERAGLVDELRKQYPETPHHRDDLHRRAADEIERLAALAAQPATAPAQEQQRAGAVVSDAWASAANWLKNNYQHHPNIASLCDAMREYGAKGLQ